jgi:hypothetical protein
VCDHKNIAILQANIRVIESIEDEPGGVITSTGFRNTVDPEDPNLCCHGRHLLLTFAPLDL